MKRIKIIVLSLLFLLQGMGSDVELCGKLEKLSNFITHYQDHKDFNDSFYQYIIEDYFADIGETEHHDMDSHEENAPQHNHHQCCYPVVFVTPPNTVSIDTIEFKEEKTLNYYNYHLKSRYLESLFQPPQV